MGACAAHEVVSDHHRGTRTGSGGDDELEKDSQANLSQLRLELRELAKWAEITTKCALSGKPHPRERSGLCQATIR